MQTKPLKLNTFKKIWIQPKETMRYIIDTDPEIHVVPLAFISGICRALLSNASAPLGALLIDAIMGGISGLIALAIGGYLLTWVGNLLGGTAERQHVRAAIGWSSLPDIALFVLLIVPTVVLGSSNFDALSSLMDSQPLLASSIPILFTSISYFFLAWRIYILANCLGEANQFSVWKGLATAVIGILILLIPTALLQLR
ncbi:MAG: Yip1 family protein [Anaerolineae bacterium]